MLFRSRTFISFLLAIIAAEHIFGVVAKGTHDYRYFIKPKELTQWALDADLLLVDKRGFWYEPFLGRCGLTGLTPVNYLMHFYRP